MGSRLTFMYDLSGKFVCRFILEINNNNSNNKDHNRIIYCSDYILILLKAQKTPFNVQDKAINRDGKVNIIKDDWF